MHRHEAKAAPTEAKKLAIVTSISRKEAKSLHWQERYAAHDVERDDDTDEALTARYRAWIASKLRQEK